MENYKMMYTKLFNKITDIIEELQAVQQETEDLYVQAEGGDVILLEAEEEGEVL
jgi:hypothetical protein